MSGRRQGCGVIAIAAVISLVLGLAGGGLGAWLYMRSLPQETAGQTQQARTTKIEVLTDEDAIVKAVERVDPAVVKIVATTVVQPSNPFDFFFGGGSRVERGVGSGVIFDYEGRKLVLTNTHVVGDAQQITVQMRNGDSY
jgi:S1-C subfamily serine protease